MDSNAALLEPRDSPKALDLSGRVREAVPHLSPRDADAVVRTVLDEVSRPVADDDEYVDTKGASRMTNGLVSEFTFSRMRQAGTGPVFCKLGHRTVAYRRGAVRAWLRDRERVSTLESKTT